MNNTISVFNDLLKIQFGGKKKWSSLFHNGVVFPPEYVPHGLPLKYEDMAIVLSPVAEEYAMIYAKYLNSEYIKIKTFNTNFWNDWKKILGQSTEIKSLDKCDFTEYHNKYNELKTCRLEKDETKYEKYKIAYVDGKEQEVGNFRIEPPGLFIGRGDNPNIGKIKRRIHPEDIIINIGKDVEIPEPLEGHKWKKVIHNRDVEWIASWEDNVTGKKKYVWLGNSSDFKANNDYKKFELARKLKKKIKKINDVNNQNLHSNDMKVKQLATALYFIDKLAIRVGNEKSSDEADTVGVTTLRVEHITMDKNQLEFDFLGKDSVRYSNTIEVDNIIANNVKLFSQGKDKYEQLFDLINSNDMNTYLQTFMKDLTAKMYRSYNASNMFQKELIKVNKKFCEENPDINLLLDEYNKANIKVAKLLNHQKNVGKSHKTQVDKIAETIKKYKSKLKKAKTGKNNDKINKIKERIDKLKNKKNIKEEMKNISLGTSKDNYIDPRITIAFMKKYNIPVDKLFPTKLQKKFKWAFEVGPDFVF
jgi:DNA topoisomerase-1